MGRPATLKIDIVADAKGVGKGADDAMGKLGRLGKAAGPVGAAVSAGLAVAAGAVVAFGLSAVRAASTAEQNMGAVESVFGKASTAVVKYSENSATRLGLAKSAYTGLAATVGSQLQTMGQSQAESAASTDKLIGLGADLAATFGGSVSDAVGAVGSLLRGERDPIERYGVAIKAADVEARLAANGQSKLEGAARKTAEAQATLALLTEQTANAQGAFAREGDTLAGSQERLKARFEDVKAALGSRLLPVMTDLSNWLLHKGVPALESFGRWVVKNKDTFITLGATVASVVLTVAENLARLVSTVYRNYASIIGHTRTFLAFFFGFADSLLGAAGKAFGWLPGIGPKIDTARGDLGRLAITADAKLAAVESGFRLASDAAGVAAAKIAEVKGKVDALKDRTVRVTYVVNGATRVVGGAGTGGVQEFTGPPLGGYGPPLVGGYGAGLHSGQLTTASSGAGLVQLLASPRQLAAPASYVDARTIDLSVHVEGALDAPAVADQLRRILDRQALRLGDATGYAR